MYTGIMSPFAQAALRAGLSASRKSWRNQTIAGLLETEMGRSLLLF
jgi:hypothetical protein